MSEVKRLVTARMMKKDGVLVNIHQRETIGVREFTKEISEGAIVDVTYELELDEATSAQVKKVHAMIGEIAAEAGLPFDEAKLLVKKHCGMAIELPAGDGKTEWQIKSFSNCSKREISNAIEAAILIGDHLKMNLRLK
jgi:hypothetical protein